MAVGKPVKIIPNIEVPMRDGTILRADLYRPDDDLVYPVLLCRTPYNKDGIATSTAALRFVKSGYVVLAQDCRGCFASDGTFYPFLNEMADGYDTVEWAAAQGWSTGKVGMFGTSYLGATQWMAAATQPPHLTTIAPAITACDYHNGWVYQSGAFLLGFALNWTLNSLTLRKVPRLSVPADKKKEIRDSLVGMLDDQQRTMLSLPLMDVDVLAKHGLAPFYFDWLTHPDEDEYWRRWSIASCHKRITVPVFSIGGWYDIFLSGTIQNFTGMRKHGASETGQKYQRLIIGPWGHSVPLFGGNTGEASFGVSSLGESVDLDGQVLRWFDHWLKGIGNGVIDEPRVSLFTLGSNKWQQVTDWPLPGTQYVKFFFHSTQAANTAQGDGILDRKEPGSEPADTYVYDPSRPVPTRGGGAYFVSRPGPGAFDQRLIEERHDVLVYTSAPLVDDMEVTGPIVVHLWASSSARDTDFSAKLVDVWPNGFAMNLADGLIRARYRNSLARPELLEPGRAYHYAIDLCGASNVFLKDHRVRVEISSSNFPRFDRNLNTGDSLAKGINMIAAVQTIFHDSERPSHIVLPLVSK